jgi:hypothetical protein
VKVEKKVKDKIMKMKVVKNNIKLIKIEIPIIVIGAIFISFLR